MKKHVLAIISFVVIFSVVFCNVFVTQASNPVGDVNGDGIIDDDDFGIISNYLNGTDTEQLFEGSPFATAADVDRDGAITQADYAIINDYLTNGEPINQA